MSNDPFSPKILTQSFPFVSEKSQSVYRLVKTDRGHHIEKVTTSTTIEATIDPGHNPEETFENFLSKKRLNRERNRKRLGTLEAFKKHHIDGLSWREIAEEAGMQGKTSIAKRVTEFIQGLAQSYLSGQSIEDLAEQVSLSPNHLHSILSEFLNRERERCLNDFERGAVMRSFESDVARVVEITDFLNDWDDFRYQVVSPFDDTASLATGKRVLWLHEFYDFIFHNGTTKRLSSQHVDTITLGANPGEPLKTFEISVQTNNPVIEVRDMWGKPSEYYTSIFAMSESIGKSAHL